MGYRPAIKNVLVKHPEEKNQTPPRLIMSFFRWFCHPDLAKYVEGDLIELYQERLQNRSRMSANWKLLIDVILLFRPGIVSISANLNSNNNYSMFKNYLKIGYRNLWKDRFYTSINLLGLSLGLTFSFLVLLLVQYEFSYENFYSNKEKIFRIGVKYNVGGKEDYYSNAPRPMGAAIKAEYPEVADYTRMRGVNGLTEHKAHLKYENDYYKSNKIFVADSTFFNVFDTKILKGDRQLILNKPNTIALSKSLASTIFGNIDPLGKEIEISENGKKLEVSGVFEDIPTNTHIPYDALVSWNGYFDGNRSQAWYGAHVYTYVKLHDAAQYTALHDRFPAFFDKYMSTTYEQMNSTADIVVQPITEVHLSPEMTWEPKPHGDLSTVYILLVIGIFLIVIAQVNYLNLSLARSSLRKKEISIRMVIGASKGNISNQFIIETMLFTSLSFLLSLMVIKMIYGEFLNLSGVDVTPFSLINLMVFAIATFGIGLLVSLYPSVVLSSINLLEGLKGKSKSTRTGVGLQRGLVVFQFAISTLVILFTFVVQNQLDFILTKDLGFNKENIVVFQLEDTVLQNRVQTIKEGVAKIAGVKSASFSSDRPGIDLNHTFASIENEGGYENIGFQFMQIDDDFIATIELNMIDGRSFIKGSENDVKTSMMINEAAMRKFGWDENPTGKKIYFNRGDSLEPLFFSTIGVFKDFNISSLHSKIDPVVVFYNPIVGNQLLVKVSSNNQKNTINDIVQLLNNYAPSIPVAYNFLDVELDRMYVEEKRLSQSMIYLSGLSILISILGFIGLLSYTISQREKEIGVRKVLGAKVSDVIFLFYKEIFILVLLGELIAFPINHYVSKLWLNSFQYQSAISFMTLGAILFAIILFSLATMGFQIIRVALMNPADVIKDE